MSFGIFFFVFMYVSFGSCQCLPFYYFSLSTSRLDTLLLLSVCQCSTFLSSICLPVCSSSVSVCTHIPVRNPSLYAFVPEMRVPAYSRCHRPSATASFSNNHISVDCWRLENFIVNLSMIHSPEAIHRFKQGRCTIVSVFLNPRLLAIDTLHYRTVHCTTFPFSPRLLQWHSLILFVGVHFYWSLFLESGCCRWTTYEVVCVYV